MNNEINEVKITISYSEEDIEIKEDEEEIGRSHGHDFKNLSVYSKFEVYKRLQPIRQDINSEMAKNLCFRNIIPIVLKNYIDEVKKTPMLWTTCKIGFVILCLYLEKNFFEGIVAGEVLLKNTSFTDLFASDTDVQNAAGGAITNAVQDVQFARDGVFILGSMYYVLFRNAYIKTRHDIIEECFDKHLSNQDLPLEMRNELFDLKIREQNK